MELAEAGKYAGEWWTRMPRPNHIPVDLVDEILREYRPTVFLETGTFRGDSVAAVLDRFDRLYSVELSKELHARAVQRFAGEPKVRIFHGSSRSGLGPALAALGPERALVWLDAHYSGGDTALEGQGLECPVLDELAQLREHGRGNDVILVDDLVYFLREETGFPGLEAVARAVRAVNPDYVLEALDLRKGVLMAAPKNRGHDPELPGT